MRPFLILMLAVNFLWSDESLLTEADIHKVMRDIFKQHVDKKELDPESFRQAVNYFIDRFDPSGIYLLESEARSYQMVPNGELETHLSEYETGDYNYFAEMSRLFQKAVLRARQIRAEQVKLYPAWTQEALTGSKSYNEEWGRRAKSLDELRDRQEELFKAYVVARARRLGKGRVVEEGSRLGKGYEEELEAEENPRLFLTAQGTPLSKNEAESLFTLEVLKALAAALDAHTKIYDPQEAAKMKSRLEEGTGVQVSSVKFGNGVIGIIRLDAFFQGAGDHDSEQAVKGAIETLEKENLRGLILDLRENTGGFLNQAVKVAGLFITNGVVVVSKYHTGEERLYRDMDGKRAYEGPLVLLVSKMTASAAEIVAGALQDYGVALIVGDDHTYGKGTIQSQTVTDPHKGAVPNLKVTVGMYYTPSGSTPQLEGIRADIVAPGPREYLKLGEAYLEGSLKQDSIPSEMNDRLAGVSPDQKEWFIRYYLPSLQKKQYNLTALLPQLKEKSAFRILNNGDYQKFLKAPSKGWPNSQDLQLKEAVEVVKDMIYLESKSRQKD